MEGSPPRMRGKGTQFLSNLRCVGITPACAGKRDETDWTTTSHRDHPRVCGEKPASMPRHTLRRGSPPRMRGKELGFHIVAVKIGITPACAGKRRCPRFRPGKTRDHPRVCGEKFYVDEVLPGDTGSPPRMRGKDGVNDSAQAVTGITPACAGKSHCRSRTSPDRWDHPRVCGEKLT